MSKLVDVNDQKHTTNRETTSGTGKCFFRITGAFKLLGSLCCERLGSLWAMHTKTYWGFLCDFLFFSTGTDENKTPPKQSNRDMEIFKMHRVKQDEKLKPAHGFMSFCCLKPPFLSHVQVSTVCRPICGGS